MKFIKDEAVRLSFTWFIITRCILILLSICVSHEFALHHLGKNADLIFYDNELLSAWGNFDTGWYLKIAREWYPDLNNSSGQAAFEQYSFFPLYPALIRIFYLAFAISPFICGLIISNVAIAFSGILLFRIVKILYDEHIASTSVICFYLFPASFIFSGVFTESLYMVLILNSFYFGMKEKWIVAGCFGFFLALCRPTGLFILIPLLFIHLEKINFKWSLLRANVCWLLLIPAGILLFIYQNYLSTGDAFMFAHNPAWSSNVENPLLNLWEGLTNSYFTLKFLSFYTLAFIFLWVSFYRRLPVSMNIIVLYSVFIPLSYGLMSMPRMMLSAFPIYILLGIVAVKYKIKAPLLVLLTFIQCYLAVCWFLGFGNVI